MKKQDYLKPCMKVRPLMYDGDVCDTLPANSGETIGGDGPWAKENDFENFEDFEYPEGTSVWED